jgi:hypothetical protein
MSPLHAYRCTGPEAFGPDVSLGSTLRRKRGFRLGVTLRDALVDWAGGPLGEGWPLRIFEVAVARSDVVDADTDAGILRTRAFSVAREVPLADAFGPRVDELSAILAGLPSIRWLRPAGAPITDACIADLVAEHHRGLSDYQPVAPLPVRVVRTWRIAQELCEDRERYYRAICESAAALAVRQAVRGTTLEAAWRIVHAHAHVAAFAGAWEAAYAAAGRGVIASISNDPLFATLHAEDPQTGERAVENVTVAHAAAREPARVGPAHPRA